ncbi:MAG: cytochrome b N-terminal domain-containing protein [Planctomycetes bacterium]|nr:cytochrome b N-terminal domain-containing protein [Planctomycetota bacterium]
MRSGVKTWIDDRLPLRAAVRWGLEEDIPGGASYAYVFGSANLFLFLLLAVTGVLQLFYYVPTTDHAYESVMYLRLQVPFGWLVHGLHYWCAQAFVVVVGLHAARVFLWGAYKNPRELTWLMGVLLLLLVAAMAFTGPLLAWDQLGYWAAEVGTSIAGTVPWIGDFLERFVRGGETMGQGTLSRFFIFHVAIVPAVLFAFIVLHLAAFRQFGGAGPWNPEARRHVGKFWPDQVYKDVLITSLAFIILVGFCVFWRAPITGVADPLGRSLTPKPAWNFLFLYQALKSFQGPWEVLGTVGVPLAIILLLFFLPFYDRNSERSPRRRPIAIVGGTALVILILALTVMGQLSQPLAIGARAAPATPQGAPPKPGAPAEPNKGAAAPSGKVASANIQKGRELYQSQGCAACHKIDGQGGAVGPDLSNEGSKGRSADWLVAQIRNPKVHNAASIMPPYPALSQEQLANLVVYLLSLHSGAEKPTAGGKKESSAVTTGAESQHLPMSGKQGPPGAAATLIGGVKLGRRLFADYCNSCHGPEGTDRVPDPGSEKGIVPGLNPIDPNLSSDDPSVFAAQIDRFIQHGSIPKGSHPAIYMPGYGDGMTLTQPQIAAIEAYILDLNGVDRAAIEHPGMSPRRFFLWTLVALGAIGAMAVLRFLVRK